MAKSQPVDRARYLKRIYRNITRRTSSGEHPLYTGLNVMTRDEFFEWGASCLVFHELYEDWACSGFNRKLAPSVDRINPVLGYVHGNVKWMTLSENAKKGANSLNRRGAIRDPVFEGRFTEFVRKNKLTASEAELLRCLYKTLFFEGPEANTDKLWEIAVGKFWALGLRSQSLDKLDESKDNAGESEA